MLLLQAQTREKETFTTLKNLVPTHRESSNRHQIPLKCSERLGKQTQGSCNMVDTHCRSQKSYTSKGHDCARGSTTFSASTGDLFGKYKAHSTSAGQTG